MTVVWLACIGAGGICSMTGLEPPPIARRMNGHAKTQIPLACFGCPCADHVSMRTNFSGVPWMEFRVPGIEAIVMVGQCNEELRACTHVQIHELRWLPIQERPLRAKVFVAEASG